MVSYICSTLIAMTPFDPDSRTLSGLRSIVILIGTAMAQLYHSSDFLHSPAVAWITVLWYMDWILGSGMALYTKQFRPRKALFSVVKWLIYILALAVAYAMLQADVLGAWFIAGAIRSGVFLAEGSSVLRKGAKLAGLKFLEVFADGLESRVDAIEKNLATAHNSEHERG